MRDKIEELLNCLNFNYIFCIIQECEYEKRLKN